MKRLIICAMVAALAVLMVPLGVFAQDLDPMNQTSISSAGSPDQIATPAPSAKTTWGQIRRLYGSDGSLKTLPDRHVTPQGGTVEAQNFWRDIGQAGRNDFIRLTALNHMLNLGGSVNRLSRPSGYNCKTWVKDYVVPVASQHVASIPSSYGYCRWNSGQYVQVVGYGPAGIGISAAQPGQIVQSKWGSYPHTFIVYARASEGIWIIDCNYDLRGGLTIHYVTYAYFQQVSGGCYTVYQVTGG